MQLTKPAALAALGHSVATIIDSSVALPDVNDAYSAGARYIVLQNIGLGEALWVAFDGTDAAIDHGMKLEPGACVELTLEDIRDVRAFSPSSCKLGVSYFR